MREARGERVEMPRSEQIVGAKERRRGVVFR
jgi:hypothetical protein